MIVYTLHCHLITPLLEKHWGFPFIVIMSGLEGTVEYYVNCTEPWVVLNNVSILGKLYLWGLFLYMHGPTPLKNMYNVHQILLFRHLHGLIHDHMLLLANPSHFERTNQLSEHICFFCPHCCDVLQLPLFLVCFLVTTIHTVETGRTVLICTCLLESSNWSKKTHNTVSSSQLCGEFIISFNRNSGRYRVVFKMRLYLVFTSTAIAQPT